VCYYLFVTLKTMMMFRMVCVKDAMKYWLQVGVDGFYVRDAAYLVEPSDLSTAASSANVISLPFLAVL